MQASILGDRKRRRQALDDKIVMVHKEGGGKKEEEGSKEDDGGDSNMGEGEERDGSASLYKSFDNENICGAITSGQVTTTTNSKDDAKEDNGGEGRMVGIPQFWVCAMGHMVAVA